MIDIDSIVQYETEYNKHIKKPSASGKNVTGLCPFHDDTNASFSADIETGQFYCFACGAKGNFIDFIARIENIDTKDAYRRILDSYGIKEDSPSQSKQTAYTIEDYAREKHLPLEWLRETCKLSEGVEKRDGAPYIRIPYYDELGKQVLYRKRYPKGWAVRFKWGYGSAGKLMMYGEWHLDKIRDTGEVVLVEGESDAQTMWYLGIPTLGVPGASIFKDEWTDKLQKLKVYLHIEPDRGGEVFLSQMTRRLREGGFKGETYTWSCAGFGVKDPSDLYIKCGDAAKELIKEALGMARRVDIYEDAVPEVIPGAPIQLRQPEGYIYSDKGISVIDPKTNAPKCVCRTPILPTRRLRNLETGEEKIEVAFKRDDEWRTGIFQRSTIFQSRTITALADWGCTVTSENAKHVVRFLEALEAENINILEMQESTMNFGWQPRNRFLPGHGDDIVLDFEPNMAHWVSAYCKQGGLNGWTKQMAELRYNPRFRFILAASFAAPLLRIVRQRSFFVYNWGDSRGGKTAALKAALSAWGDPDRLMVSFNATQVGLERIARCFTDLPLGIDERQTAGSRQEYLERIVYMISGGTGRVRGAKTGGIQALQTWRTVCLSTGEEPIAQDASMTGVTTRMIEITNAPFDSEAAAAEIHQTCAANCGWAGPEFVGWVREQSEDKIVVMYEDIVSRIRSKTPGNNSAHITSVAVVALADSLIDQVLFDNDEEGAVNIAVEMGAEILKGIKENEVQSVNDSALQFVTDWAGMNRESFVPYARPCYGFREDECLYIYPSALKDALEKAGYSYRKTVKFLADFGYIQKDRDGRNTVVTRVNDSTARMIALDTKAIGRSSAMEQARIDDAPW